MDLSASEAARLLGVTLPTLYAYVSRGLIRSSPVAGTRGRRYRREDVDALVLRKEQRRDPAATVAHALDFGAPVLDSALTEIREGQLFYRGRNACALAETASVEEVARLLWTGSSSNEPFSPLGPPSGRVRAVLAATEDLRPIDRFQAVVPVAAADDPAAWDLRPAAMAATGERILGTLASVAANQVFDGPIAQNVAAAWGADPDLIRVALVLCADHELNVSSFVARCVASAGSTAWDAVSAGLAALRGTRHGGHTERVEALLAEAGRVGAASAIEDRLRRGEAIPGFGHPLYPDGDPRAAYLLDLLARARPGEATSLALGLADVAAKRLGLRPTIDLGLAATARALALPPGRALALFALGRTTGWVAHAIEQAATGQLIRPRAHYVGRPPE
jgi:citrate synthase